MLPGWSIFRPWPTSRGKTKCFIWAADLIMGSMAFCISGGKQYRQQRAAFWAGLCICRQHCAVNGINVRKIIRCLLLPQFAVRQYISISFSFQKKGTEQYLPDPCPCKCIVPPCRIQLIAQRPPVPVPALVLPKKVKSARAQSLPCPHSNSCVSLHHTVPARQRALPAAPCSLPACCR